MKIHKTNLKASSFLHMIAAASITVCMLTSCNGGLTDQSESDPADTYRNYLLEVRKMKSISFDELAENLCQWQTIRDSVFSHVQQDTVGLHGQDLRKTCESIHDSLRVEFSRLALSRPRSYQELFLLKRKLSSNDKDNELIRAIEKIRPFFESLDKRPIHKGDRMQIISDYRALLANTLRNGIHGIEDMTEFIGKEDAIFRAFLPYLCSIGDEDISDITRDTEKCCLQILFAAERKEIPHKDALVYLAMRTNRRLILNTRTCINDIHNQKVQTKAQAYAYIWMLMRPYVSMDSFHLSMLSSKDQEQLERFAVQTPAIFETLCRILNSGDNRLDELPGMLMEIYIHTL